MEHQRLVLSTGHLHVPLGRLMAQSPPNAVVPALDPSHQRPHQSFNEADKYSTSSIISKGVLELSDGAF
jgi:hypothetical protein